jgi:histidinol-phosphate aminotransferase
MVWASLDNVPLNTYPDSRPFINALQIYADYPKENIVIGAGMDEIITMICRLFLGPGDRAFIPVPTYNLYGLAAQICGAKPIYQLKPPGLDWNLDIPEESKMVFLCSPNNPTGESISERALRDIVEETRAVVFLDEAYAEFAGDSFLGLVKEYDNLVIGRTLSKAFGLAGLRLGYAIMPKWLSEQYKRIAPLFSVGSLSLAAGEAALKDLDWMKQSVSKIVLERERMRQNLKTSLCSEGNFLYLHTPEKSAVIAERLMSRGVVVRDCSVFHGSGEHCMRVTVGTPKENDRFLEVLSFEMEK